LELTGGCTLIFDLDSLALKYAISKPLLDMEALREKGQHQINLGRAQQVRKQRTSTTTAYDAYFAVKAGKSVGEPFAFLHTH
jgi:hypothetical protein